MSFWDNVKKFAQPYADDEYDDYDEDDEYLDEDYEEEAPAPRRSSNRAATRRAPVSAPVEDDLEEEDFGFGLAPATPSTPAAAPAAGGFSGRVLNTSGPKQEVVLFRPVSFNDTTKAADALRNRKAVVLNLENVDKAMSRRVVDFLSGCVYALDGTVNKIAQSAYLFCPHNMDIVGDVENLQTEVESYT